ncbi:hypothetical protein [Kitasatospora sp. GAS1066B]|uniref:hypothetical protein n=1 Tax=Kitasatospora sp. GAS1066B TaxID=3156271 RepID=UPI003517387B
MDMLKKIFAVSALTGVLALSGGTAMAATAPAAARTARTATTVTVAPSAQEAALAGVSYTFDHATTVQIYNLLQKGATTGAVALCEAVIPPPAGSIVCSSVGTAAGSIISLGTPGPNDKLHVGAQLGWPPIVITYVR